MKKSAAFCIIFVAMSAVCASAAITGSVVPNSISPMLNPGETQTFQFDYCANITAGSGKADVLFLTDTTGSMGGYISGIRSAFPTIVSTIAADLPGVDIQYGVADYKDYRDGGNYAANGVNMIQSFTTDTDALQAAMNSMYAVNGFDLRESQLTAMVNLANNWMTTSGLLGFNGRADAQKILIWAGDVEGHFAGEITPPGEALPDGPPGYYPTLAQALDALNAQGILTFGLNLKSAQNGIDALAGGANQATYLTDGTGGGLHNDLNLAPAAIQEAVANAVMQGVDVLTNITLVIESEEVIANQIAQTLIGSWTPGDGDICDSFTFEITGSDEPGTIDFDMVLMGNGAEIERVNVHLTTIPEPTTILLIGLGGLGLLRRRKV